MLCPPCEVWPRRCATSSGALFLRRCGHAGSPPAGEAGKRPCGGKGIFGKAEVKQTVADGLLHALVDIQHGKDLIAVEVACRGQIGERLAHIGQAQTVGIEEEAQPVLTAQGVVMGGVGAGRGNWWGRHADTPWGLRCWSGGCAGLGAIAVCRFGIAPRHPGGCPMAEPLAQIHGVHDHEAARKRQWGVEERCGLIILARVHERGPARMEPVVVRGDCGLKIKGIHFSLAGLHGGIVVIGHVHRGGLTGAEEAVQPGEEAGKDGHEVGQDGHGGGGVCVHG